MPILVMPAPVASPADLDLGGPEIARSEALSHFAWGFFLQLHEEMPSDRSQEHYLEALRLDPGNRLLLQYVVAPWVVLRDHQSIVDHLLPMAKANPTEPRLQVVVGLALQALDQNGQAVELYEHAFDCAPSPGLLRELAAAYWRDQRYQANPPLFKRARRHRDLQNAYVTDFARTVYHRSMAINPQAIKTSRRQPEWHAKQAGHYARAAAERAADCENPRDLEQLASILQATGDWEALATLYHEAAKAFPAQRTAYGINEGVALVKAGDRALAARLLTEIDINQVPDAHMLLLLGSELADLGELTEAARALNRSLLFLPNAKQIRLTLAYLWLRLDQPDEAIQLLQATKKLPPTGLLIESQAHARLRQYDQAYERALEAEKIAKEKEETDFIDAGFLLYVASLGEETGRLDATITYAEAALGKTPDDPVVANFLGYVLADHGLRLEEAEGLIRQAVGVEPDSHAYMDSLAWVAFRRGRLTEALELINRTLTLSGAEIDPVVLDHAGDIYQLNGFQLLAVRYWWQSLQAGGPNSEAIRRKIDAAAVNGVGISLP